MIGKIVKKKSAVVFGATSNMTFAIAAVMMDLKKYSPNIASEVVILHDGINVNDKKLLNSILPTRFITYDFPIKDLSNFNQDTLKYFSKMVYSKFECFNLLNDYEKVLFLDYDIVIKADISELFNYIESGWRLPPASSKVRDNLHSPIIDYDMDVETAGAGIFVMQDNLLNFNVLHKWCYEKTEKYAKHLYLPEQAIFDFLIQEFKLKPEKTISPRIYICHPNDVENVKDAKILHAWGQPKFWNGTNNTQWNENYKRWIEMGGSEYKDPNKFLMARVKRKLLRILELKDIIGEMFRLLKLIRVLRRNSLIYKYLLSPQFKVNTWSLEQCKNYSKDFEKVFYAPDFTKRLDQLTSNMEEKDQKKLKFLFARMLFISFLNRESIFDEDELKYFEENEHNQKNVVKSDGFYTFLGIKFKNRNMTGHNFNCDMGLALLKDLPKLRNKSIVDVGAYVGDSSLLLAKYTDKKVYAFEPFDNAYSDLVANIKLNNSKNIIPVKKGISDEVGVKKLYFAADGLSISTNDPETSLSKGACSEVMNIETITIDKFSEENDVTIGVIKIDAEGAEQFVLRGALETIKKDRPVLLVSIYHNIGDFMDIKPWLDNLNLNYKYKIFKPESTTFVEETLLVCYQE